MLLKRTIITFFASCFFASVVVGQEKALSCINEADLIRNLSFIASDSLQGRCLGTEVDGLGITANYLAENAKRLGLKPGAENYFQKVEMLHSKKADDNFIEVKNEKGKRIDYTSDVVCLNGESEMLEMNELQIEFVGFGDSISTKNIEGKVVVVAQGDANIFRKQRHLKNSWDNKLEHTKIDSLQEYKPAAIILVTSPNDKTNKVFYEIKAWFKRARYRLKPELSAGEPPVLITVPGFADSVLGGHGKYARYLKHCADENAECVELAEELKANLKVGGIFSSLESNNVIGIVEGSDPKLKDEYVVFMAHYDHVGVDAKGNVFNGADDNGSGTVALMEAAKAFCSLTVKPKRSIVFLWVTCEEIGQMGSAWYVEHPLLPLEKTVACINLDMVGRVYEPRDSVYKNSAKKIKDFDGLYTLTNDVWPQLAEINIRNCEKLGIIPDTSLPKNPYLRTSDHYQFHKKGVPVLNYATGYHADYHKIGDEVEKINFKKIKRVAELCYLVGLELANCSDVPARK